MPGSQLQLRTATQSDMELLFSLLREALGPYVAQTFGAWNDAEERERFFLKTDPATHQVVEREGRAVGCLRVVRSDAEIRIQRVFLFPRFQNQGIGDRLVRQILSEAEAADLPVRLRVFKVNPARRFYERLGFVVAGETEHHTLMEWNQEATKS